MQREDNDMPRDSFFQNDNMNINDRIDEGMVGGDIIVNYESNNNQNSYPDELNMDSFIN